MFTNIVCIYTLPRELPHSLTGSYFLNNRAESTSSLFADEVVPVNYPGHQKFAVEISLVSAADRETLFFPMSADEVIMGTGIRTSPAMAAYKGGDWFGEGPGGVDKQKAAAGVGKRQANDEDEEEEDVSEEEDGEEEAETEETQEQQEARRQSFQNLMYALLADPAIRLQLNQ